ncbi:proto-oncogene tyrosine-protein kinase receptor Ret [Caerostris extrusa]|uniref:Proto-oncogene tyrosine-protein kinase receptor Ret n=1 Tax=Caerostris extrusa TaxID=172846 RepID=A0AAV4MRH7_CAEEX|nr:proto-oncogene tyrosine-protein kinase receptor Ret [Caerostris extrusa]
MNGVVVFHVQISNSSLESTETIFIPDEYQVVANVFRHSARHTRIIQPMEVKRHEGYFFRLVRDANQGMPENRIFGVTRKTGILYIMDEVALSRSATKLFRLELTWRNKDVTDRQCIVLIRVLDSGELSSGCGIEIGHQFSSCAVHGTAEECSTSCGRGANGGFCQWRSHSSSPSSSSTTPPVHHTFRPAPTEFVTNWKRWIPIYVPKIVHGEAIPNRNGRGVGKSAAPCTCGGANFCTCARGFEPSHLVSRSQTKSKKEAPNIKSQPLNLSEDWSGCGTQCITMIVIVSLIVSGLVVVAGILTYRRWTAHPKDEELPSVRTPLNSSTYLVARATTDYPLQPSIVKGEKLEFPRDQLTLEETLGEGEFGKVVKGKAKNIASIPGVTTVAVKMLKEGSSASEKRDLVSELNLLKEISHPNVIRLLGASTDDNGQLYIIMEYAEHGSLVTYLRNLKNFYVNRK